jgi:hypothetical protein
MALRPTEAAVEVIRTTVEVVDGICGIDARLFRAFCLIPNQCRKHNELRGISHPLQARFSRLVTWTKYLAGSTSTTSLAS